MQRADTFIGWGCEPVWTLDEGADYPRLWWENEPGDIITTPSPLESVEGSGKQGDPYLIRTPEQLSMVGAFPCGWNKHFKLMADIDLHNCGTDEFNAIGVAEHYAFSGVFDGNGKIISNFNCTSTRADYIGLFGYVRGAEIRNLGLTKPNVGAEIARNVGSLVGCIKDGTLRGCYIEDCNVSGNERHARVGSLAGENIGGIITDCYSNGSVSAAGERAQAGGFAGRNGGGITNCYSATRVSALGSDARAGGLAGASYFGQVTASLWDVQASGQTTSAGGTGKTTAEMQMASTFIDAGWDFVGESTNGLEDIWAICDGADYPKLKWQFVIGDFDGDRYMDFGDFCIFAKRWLQSDESFWCGGGGADLTNDGDVDFGDLNEWLQEWLTGP
jgi:hypothetical protein